MRERRWRRLAGALVLLLAGCGLGDQRMRERLLVWNTESTLDVVGAAPAQFDAAVANASQALARMSVEWHAWKPSELVRINQALAAGQAAPAPASVRDLVERSRPLVLRSQGLFDPGIGGLIEMWGFHTEDYPIRTPAPDADTLARWLADRPSLLDLQVEGDQLRSDNPAVQLDFGAVGEGAAIEAVLRVLQEAGIRQALFTLGGDVYALGREWRVAIEDPIGTGRAPLAAIGLRDREGLFTSGNYARFRYSPSGERWPHILDPRTGRPATGVALTAVVARDPLLGDVASTVLMIAGPARFEEMLQRLQLHCALLLTDQNELMITRALQARIELMRRPIALGPAVDRGADCTP